MNHDANLPFITIVMPVYNEARFIAQTLGQLLEQKYPSDRFEILVVDGMSTDRTREIVTELSSRHPNIFLLDNPKHRSSAGRNVGFKAGQGEYFLVVDGHCFIPSYALLSNMVDCFARSGADCLGRPQPLDPPNLAPFQQAVALARGSRFGHGGDSMIYRDYEGFASPVSNGAVYRKDVFEKIGYVDETFDACEDVEFNYRVEQAGLTCYTSPKLTIRYYPRENLPGLFRQMIRYGEGRFRFIKKHREALTINQLIPAGFVAGMLLLTLSVFIELWGNRVTWFLGFFYGVYLVVSAFESLRVAAQNGWRCISYLPWIFVVIHFGLGWGFIKQGATHLVHRVKPF
ncbi:MAG: glycosyltransferase family 2 protein [Chlorobium sp.]|nr:glycosyltransferase family 2 protein [Chlorobium sp.]